MNDRRFIRVAPERHASGAAHGKKKRIQICVVDAQICAAQADPDDQAPELTGFYQEKTSGRPRYTLQVNQAGDHVVGERCKAQKTERPDLAGSAAR
jgi:hypothetical protein